MFILQPTTFICHFRTVLEKKSPAGPTALLEDDVQEDEPENKNNLFCRKCRNSITSIDERISVDGSHQHTFANPHGILFEIGCFKTAIGCGYTGIPTDDFSWFKGYRWRIAVCGSCLAHMGWLFISPENDSFFNGLILDRLISEPQDDGQNNFSISHPSFGPSLSDSKSQKPRNRKAIPAAFELPNRTNLTQICAPNDEVISSIVLSDE